MALRNPFRRREVVPQHAFTGNCLVREFTHDGHCVGRCWFSTYDGICPRHGDVSKHLTDAGWPRDFELAIYDGSPWAETLREEWKDR